MPSDEELLAALKQIVEGANANDKLLLQLVKTLTTRMLEIDARVERLELVLLPSGRTQ